MKSINYHFDNAGKIMIPNRPGFFMRWFSVATRAYLGSFLAFLTFILCLVTIVYLNVGEFGNRFHQQISDKLTKRLGVSSILFITATIISLVVSIGTVVLQRQQSADQLTPYILQRYEQREQPDPSEVLNNTYESTTLPRRTGIELGHVNEGYVPDTNRLVHEPTNELQNVGYVGLDGFEEFLIKHMFNIYFSTKVITTDLDEPPADSQSTHSNVYDEALQAPQMSPSTIRQLFKMNAMNQY